VQHATGYSLAAHRATITVVRASGIELTDLAENLNHKGGIPRV
jgi:hypothetical protein